MNKRKASTEKSYGIVGIGRFGRALAMSLAKMGREILVIDSDEERVRDLRQWTENAFVVGTLDKNALMQTGIQNCDVVVVCIGEKIDVSLLTTLHLVTLGVPRVIAKANSAEQGEILAKLGAEVVYPEQDMAIRLARRLETSGVVNYIELSEKIDLSVLRVPTHLVGKTIRESDIRKRYGLNIIAIEQGELILTTLDPSYLFHQDDLMIVLGDNANIARFEAAEN